MADAGAKGVRLADAEKEKALGRPPGPPAPLSLPRRSASAAAASRPCTADACSARDSPPRCCLALMGQLPVLAGGEEPSSGLLKLMAAARRVGAGDGMLIRYSRR